MGNLKVAPGCSVNLHDARSAFFHRRAQKRQFALLGDFEIFDNRTHGAKLGPAE